MIDAVPLVTRFFLAIAMAPLSLNKNNDVGYRVGPHEAVGAVEAVVGVGRGLNCNNLRSCATSAPGMMMMLVLTATFSVETVAIFWPTCFTLFKRVTRLGLNIKPLLLTISQCKRRLCLDADWQDTTVPTLPLIRNRYIDFMAAIHICKRVCRTLVSLCLSCRLYHFRVNCRLKVLVGIDQDYVR